MKQVNTEIDGRMYVVQVPDDELDYSRGLVVGPPDLDVLELPQDITDRLHNELFVRGLITKKRLQREQVFAALQAALQVSTEKIIALYR